MLNRENFISAFSTGWTSPPTVTCGAVEAESYKNGLGVRYGWGLRFGTIPLSLRFPALLHVPNVNDVVESELTFVGRVFYQMVVPRLIASATSGFDSSSLFFTGGYRFRCISFRWSRIQLSYQGSVLWSVFFGDVGDFCGFDSDKDSLSW
jgi:hypothetical protein